MFAPARYVKRPDLGPYCFHRPCTLNAASDRVYIVCIGQERSSQRLIRVYTVSPGQIGRKQRLSWWTLHGPFCPDSSYQGLHLKVYTVCSHPARILDTSTGNNMDLLQFFFVHLWYCITPVSVIPQMWGGRHPWGLYSQKLATIRNLAKLWA